MRWVVKSTPTKMELLTTWNICLNWWTWKKSYSPTFAHVGSAHVRNFISYMTTHVRNFISYMTTWQLSYMGSPKYSFSSRKEQRTNMLCLSNSKTLSKVKCYLLMSLKGRRHQTWVKNNSSWACPCRIEKAHPPGQNLTRNLANLAPGLNSHPWGEIFLSYMGTYNGLLYYTLETSFSWTYVSVFTYYVIVLDRIL